MSTLLHDFRYSVRMLFKKPLFSLIAVITLALGIGANVAVFSILHAVLLRPLAYSDPDRLLKIRGGSSYPDMEDWASQSKTIESFAGYRSHLMDLTSGPEPERIEGALVTGNLLPLLGVEPAIGRSIGPQDDKKGAPHILVLSHSFWQQKFSSDSKVVGRSIFLSGNSYTIVGVMPSGFKLPMMRADLYAPMKVESVEEAEARGAHTLIGLARLKKGISMHQAQAEMNEVARKLEKLYPDENTNRRVILQSLRDFQVADIRKPLLLLMGATFFVLLIATANVANLLLARGKSREKEIAIRTALGAGRLRITRQLFIENLMLAVLGGIAGALLAFWIRDLLTAIAPASIEIQSVQIDLPVLLFTGAVSLMTGLLFGMAPAFHSFRINIQDSLKEGDKGVVSRMRFRDAMVVAEIALALVLLIGAGLLIRSLYRLYNVKTGFEPRNLVTFNIALPLTTYAEIPKRTLFFNSVLEKIRALPGVEYAGATSQLPFRPSMTPHNFIIAGRPTMTPGTEPDIYNRTISIDYFRAMKIPLKKGRDFNAQDSAESMPVVIVNESMVRTYFPNEEPIGKRLKWARAEEAPWMTIVGVVGDIKPFTLDAEEEPALYTPLSQEGFWWKSWSNVVIRSKSDRSIAASLRKAVAEVDHNIPVAQMATMEGLIAESTSDRRFQLLLLSSFAALALLLAAIGIYGVVTYTVDQRRREFGLRMALGAQPGDVMRLVLRQGLFLSIVGVAAGMAASFLLTRFLSGLLYGVEPIDLATFASTPLVLVAISLFACLLPARKATRVNPVQALHYE